MMDLTKIIPVSFFLFAFFYLFINGLLLRKNKIGIIGKSIYKTRFCSLTNLKTGNSSAYMSKVIITEKYIYFLTNILFYTISYNIGLLKKIPIEQIKDASIWEKGKNNQKRIYLELYCGENFILKCSNQTKLLKLLNDTRSIQIINK
jgi:hypothetical protein